MAVRTADIVDFHPPRGRFPSPQPTSRQVAPEPLFSQASGRALYERDVNERIAALFAQYDEQSLTLDAVLRREVTS